MQSQPELDAHSQDPALPRPQDRQLHLLILPWLLCYPHIPDTGNSVFEVWAKFGAVAAAGRTDDCKSDAFCSLTTSASPARRVAGKPTNKRNRRDPLPGKISRFTLLSLRAQSLSRSSACISGALLFSADTLSGFRSCFLLICRPQKNGPLQNRNTKSHLAPHLQSTRKHPSMEASINVK